MRCGIATDSRVWHDVLKLALRHQEEAGPPHPRAVSVVTTGGGVPTDRARGFSYLRGPGLSADEGKATGGMTGATCRTRSQ